MTTLDFCSINRQRRLPRHLLEAQLGPAHEGPEILAGLRAVPLARLPTAGTLYLSAAGSVVAVHDTPDPEIVTLIHFPGDTDDVWAQVAALYPGVAPGTPSFPRFRLVVEPTGPGFPPTIGVLDLRTLRVVERGGDAASLRERVRQANATPEAYLQAIAQGEAVAADAELRRHLTPLGGAVRWAA